MPNNNPQILAAFVTRHLSDSIKERREVLTALLDILPRKNVARVETFRLLQSLDHHLELQREFQFGGAESNGKGGQ